MSPASWFVENVLRAWFLVRGVVALHQLWKKHELVAEVAPLREFQGLDGRRGSGISLCL